MSEALCFAVCAAVCNLSQRAERVPAFRSESERGAFVREVEKRDEKRLEDKIYGGSFPTFSHPLIVVVHREPGNVCI